jgi:hypothetical protein
MAPIWFVYLPRWHRTLEMSNMHMKQLSWKSSKLLIVRHWSWLLVYSGTELQTFHPPKPLEIVRPHFRRWYYRLIDKYMPQPDLMKMRKTFIYKTCLSSDVASIAFAYFLNSLHPSLKYAIQFSLIQTPQNPLQALKNWSSSPRWIRSSFLWW